VSMLMKNNVKDQDALTFSHVTTTGEVVFSGEERSELVIFIDTEHFDEMVRHYAAVRSFVEEQTGVSPTTKPKGKKKAPRQ
jgi:hypothetical protein